MKFLLACMLIFSFALKGTQCTFSPSTQKLQSQTISIDITSTSTRGVGVFVLGLPFKSELRGLVGIWEINQELLMIIIRIGVPYFNRY